MVTDKTLELAKFTDQPFKLLPSEKVTAWAGYHEIRQNLLEIIESPRADRVGLYEFAIIHGELGAGKSHALRYLRYLITDKQKDEFKSIVCYVERLRVEANTDFLALYRAIMRLIKDDLKKVGEIICQISIKEVDKAWEAASADVKKLMKKDTFRDKTLPTVYSKLSPSYPALPCLLTAIYEGDELASAILLGSKAKITEVHKYGLDNCIDTEYEALRCLSGLVNLCTKTDKEVPDLPVFKCFYLFIDEVEKLRDFPTKNVQSINQGIRDLVNGCPEHFCLLLGASSPAEEVEAYMEDDVMTRLSRELIEIPELDVDQAVNFIKEVIQQYRQLDANVPAAYPFTEDALKEIALQSTRRTPRNLFRGCQTVLRKAILVGSLGKKGIIDSDEVHEFLV